MATNIYAFVDFRKVNPLQQDVEVSNTARIQCYGKNVVWMFHDSEDLPSNVRIEEYGVLLIQDVDFHNDGTYECKGDYFWKRGLSFYGRSQLRVYGNVSN